MSWVCPACGCKNDETTSLCMCGYHVDDSVLAFTNNSQVELQDEPQAEKEPSEIIDTGIAIPQPKAKIPKIKTANDPPVQRQDKIAEETIIKEIDSWQFSFSQSDKCIYLGTPALKAFRLKLTIDDLQELMELLYKKYGINKTTRKVELPINEIAELVGIVERMIEEKRARFKIKLSEEEITKIAALINDKIKA